jgi:hypothetical protein
MAGNGVTAWGKLVTAGTDPALGVPATGIRFCRRIGLTLETVLSWTEILTFQPL